MNQSWDPAAYARDARYVTDLGAPVVALLAPRPGERILDLGCGDGVLTRRIADAGCQVVGIDASPEMVEAAAALGLDVRVMNGEELTFDNEFDAVFSNAALHWMTRPDLVIRGVWRALRAGGRFVGEFGGHGNIATIVEALAKALGKRGVPVERVNPWYFPTAEEYRRKLEENGFTVHECRLIPRPTPIDTHLIDWLNLFARRFLEVIPGLERPAFLEEVSGYCEPKLRGQDGRWHIDYVRLRFAATKGNGTA